jgi:heat shock protein HtpX
MLDISRRSFVITDISARHITESAVSVSAPGQREIGVSDLRPKARTRPALRKEPFHGNHLETSVLLGSGILHLLDRRELRGVLAHELAHIENRDMLVSSVAAAAASIITYLAQALSFNSLFGGGNDDQESDGTGGILAIVVAPIAASLIQMGISRSREYLADETGSRISGDPEALARALVKLEQGAHALPGEAVPATASLFIINPFGAAASRARWFSTHPETRERVERLLALARVPLGSRAGRGSTLLQQS